MRLIMKRKAERLFASAVIVLLSTAAVYAQTTSRVNPSSDPQTNPMPGTTVNGSGAQPGATSGDGAIDCKIGDSKGADGVGVYGETVSGFGVLGIATTGEGVGVVGYFSGGGIQGIGVYGVTADGGFGVRGETDRGFGVFGRANGGTGVHGESAGIGVHGTSSGGGSIGNGVLGQSTGVNGTGVQGEANNGIAAYGIWGRSTSGVAGFFSGRVTVTGTLSKGGGSFKIDHPLDPENKYLSHSFVESPDMMNIYNGNATTDEQGTAAITLPDYFTALNRDYRYQLTVIGQFAQAIISSKISDNRFTIQTDKPHVEVSWQVTGIRQDHWANKHRIPVEEAKPASERGHYLHPELFDAPEEKGIEWAHKPDAMKRMKEEREKQSKETPQP